MLRLPLGLLTAVLLWGAALVPATAQAMCGDRGEILEQLQQSYAERPQAIGLSQDGGLLEVMVSPGGGWTILITYPKRPTCVIATGRGWESVVALAGQPA